MGAYLKAAGYLEDVPGAGWPVPEEAANLNTTEMGNLHLNHGEELAIVSFLKTLSDGYMP